MVPFNERFFTSCNTTQRFLYVFGLSISQSPKPSVKYTINAFLNFPAYGNFFGIVIWFLSINVFDYWNEWCTTTAAHLCFYVCHGLRLINTLDFSITFNDCYFVTFIWLNDVENFVHTILQVTVWHWSWSIETTYNINCTFWKFSWKVSTEWLTTIKKRVFVFL